MQLNHHRAGAGEPLLLVHGIGSRWQVWDPVLEELARRRDVIAIDLPGFGQSPPPPPGAPPDPACLARLVAEFLDGLGVGQVHAAGNSLGGWVSLELAKLGRASSVTALAPAGLWRVGAPRYPEASLRISRRGSRLLRRAMPAMVATPLGRRIAFGQMSVHPERMTAREALEASRALATAPGFEPVLRAMGGTRFFGGAEIRVPVTVGFPEHDRLLTRRLAQHRDELPEHARCITLEGCGHVPTWDDPGQIARVLLDGSARR